MTYTLPFPEQERMQGEIRAVLEDLTTGECLFARALPVGIGRGNVSSPASDHETERIYLKDGTVSRIHAELTANMEHFFLMDLFSKNDTFVNAERLTPYERREVVSGDTVCFGRAKYRILIPPCKREADFPKKEEPSSHVPDKIERTHASDTVSFCIIQPTKQGLFSRLFRRKDHNNVQPVGGIRHDPIEDDVRYKYIFQEVDAELDERFPVETHMLGSCHGIWLEKKRILKERYGIDWRTPDEMNPGVMFD